MKRIYLSGPMTGLVDFNRPAFKAEAERLRGLGYEVLNPAEFNHDLPFSWEECLRKDLIAMLTCDTVVMLRGWQRSSGAHLEMNVAHRIGMEIVMAEDVGAVAPERN